MSSQPEIDGEANTTDKYLWRQLLDFIPAAGAVFDRELIYLEVSRRWKEDFHLTDHDLIGRCHYDVFPEIPDHWKETHRRCLAGVSENCEAERFVRASGEVCWLHWAVQPWKTRDGEIGGIVMFSERLDKSAKQPDASRREMAQLATMDFATLLRWLLDQRRLTQTATAEMLGVNRVGIARMVIGQRAPTAEMCERLADAPALTTFERYALYLAAARAKGYKV